MAQMSKEEKLLLELRRINPCVNIYGPGPDGATCKTCANLFYHQLSKRYYKCSLRGCTHGPGTDHRVSWPACSKFLHRKNQPA
jgi:hypothetical protein